MRGMRAVAVLCAAAIGCGPVPPADDGSAPGDAALEGGIDARGPEAGPDAASEAGADAISSDPVDERRRCGPMCLPTETCGPDGYCTLLGDAGRDAASEGGPSCPAPTRRCGLDCVDTTRETAACGACDRPCPGLGAPNITVRCVASACSSTCVAPFGDCDGNVANGCEQRIGDSLNCGMCGRRCPDGQHCEMSAASPFGACVP
jgi:hypothetical protein